MAAPTSTVSVSRIPARKAEVVIRDVDNYVVLVASPSPAFPGVYDVEMRPTPYSDPMQFQLGGYGHPIPPHELEYLLKSLTLGLKMLHEEEREDD